MRAALRWAFLGVGTFILGAVLSTSFLSLSLLESGAEKRDQVEKSSEQQVEAPNAASEPLHAGVEYNSASRANDTRVAENAPAATSAEVDPAALVTDSVELHSDPPAAPSARGVTSLFSAKRRGHTLLLEGAVPDLATAAKLAEIARDQFFSAEVVNATHVSRLATPNLLAAARIGLEQLSFLAEGELVLSDSSMTLKGVSLYTEAARRAPENLAAKAPGGWTVKASVGLREGEKVGIGE